MELSGIKAQTNQEYVSLLSNPEFLKIVKTAKGDSRYSSLMSSLEKLNSLLEQSGEVSSKTDSSLKIVTNNNSPTNKLNDTVDEEMAKIRKDKLIAINYHLHVELKNVNANNNTLAALEEIYKIY